MCDSIHRLQTTVGPAGVAADARRVCPMASRFGFADHVIIIYTLVHVPQLAKTDGKTCKISCSASSESVRMTILSAYNYKIMVMMTHLATRQEKRVIIIIMIIIIK